ncbi:MAG: hypothetical protein MUE84_13035 [Hyphomonas sp.]|nr:hypothetical protein [Hyphomonas sp.]
MLIAALSVVFHGAFAVIEHPLQVQAHHDCDGHGKLVAAEQSPHGSHGSHHHEVLPVSSPEVGDHADQHGKIKDANSCCSTVSAALLPRGQAGEILDAKPARLRAVLRVTGDGEAPPTPSKPPKQTYQS